MNENRYAILIGSSQFPNEKGLMDLRCPENDVDAFAEVLTEQGDFTEVQIIKNQPSHYVLIQINKLLRGCAKNDLIVLYFSGHGKLNLSGELYFATFNTVVNTLESTSIPISTLKTYMDVSPCQKIILILDCCFSGAAGKAFVKSGIDDQLQLISRGRGIYILTSSTGLEVAREKESDLYSVFTKHLIEGITEGKADLNGDGFVSVNELYSYVHDEVTKEGCQEPMQWNINVRGSAPVIARTGKVLEIERLVIDAIIRGELVPFLGEGINLCNRPRNERGDPENWEPGCSYPPIDIELAEYLTEKFGSPYRELEIPCPLCQFRREDLPEGCPVKKRLAENVVVTCPLFEPKQFVEAKLDLQYISQYIHDMFGTLGFYNELHRIFARPYEPNELHQFFANLPAVLRDQKCRHPYQLIVTTNYDNTLEQAFKKAKEPYDLVSYIPTGENRGRFQHSRFPENGECIIYRPDTYAGLSLKDRSVILKLYGALAENEKEKSSFVITEEEHDDYLLKTNISEQLPVSLRNKLFRSNVLFLGHSLRDRKKRIILKQIWTELQRRGRNNWWAIQPDLGQVEKEHWKKYNVKPIDISLEDFINGLNKRMKRWKSKEVPHES